MNETTGTASNANSGTSQYHSPAGSYNLAIGYLRAFIMSLPDEYPLNPRSPLFSSQALSVSSGYFRGRFLLAPFRPILITAGPWQSSALSFPLK